MRKSHAPKRAERPEGELSPGLEIGDETEASMPQTGGKTKRQKPAPGDPPVVPKAVMPLPKELPAKGSPDWQEWVSRIEAKQGHRICGAKARGGWPCPVRPVGNGTGKCRLHGGASLTGAAAPGFKHGQATGVHARRRMAGYLPTSVEEAAAIAYADQDYLSLQEEIATKRGVVMDLYSRQRDGVPGVAFWQALRAQSAQWRKGMMLVTDAGMLKVLNDMCDTIDELAKHAQAEADLAERIREEEDLLKRMIEADTKRKAIDAQVIDAPRAVAMVQGVIMAMLAVMTNGQERARAASQARLQLATHARLLAPLPGEEVAVVEAHDAR